MLRPSRWKTFLVLASVVFGILFSLPNVLTPSQLASWPGWLPHQKLNLGLDLQGGSYLLYEVDTDALRKERLTNLLEEARQTLREAKIEITDPTQTVGDVSFRITDPAQVAPAMTALAKVGSPLANGVRDVTVSQTGDQHIRLAFVAQAASVDAANAVRQSIEIIRKRIDEMGTKEPAITPQGVDRIVIEAPGESDPEKLKALIGQTAKLTFQAVDETITPEDAAANHIPSDDVVMQGTGRGGQGAVYAIKKRIIVSGEMLTHAGQDYDQNGQPAVSLKFNGKGGKRFGDFTTQNVGKRFAIVLDNKVISAPTVISAILGGTGQITNMGTVEDAQKLATLLNSGALPAPLKVEEQRTVGAEVGADAIKAGAISLAIGAVAIVVFIVLAYGTFGLFATVALIINVLMMIGTLSMTQATLTLPGIAGLILTMAVAVDANVLIYERMRDEARSGRAPMAAADTGYRLALVSIIDANVTTMISALIMFYFGAGPVKGFAWTLSIGVLTSVFTAVIVTQLLIGWWFRIAKPKTLPIS